NVYQIAFGSRTRQYQDYNALEGVDFGPFTANYKTLVGMAVCIAVILAIALALLLTRLGKATRAVADNPSLAAASGIDVERVIRVVWTVGAAAAGLAGIVLGMSQGVRFTMGTQILLLVFAGVTLGGLGTAFGALVGSLLVGLFIQLSTLYVAEELKIASALFVMIVVLLVRPQGILGRRERVG
ncbi:MAG TPA: branched-chain amino acid ABC transporter permease, partial [Actinomycetes bacterium]|nr:branched-chain amino acid ABC transporter permease [Actinomycetes bacterium]